MPKSCLFEQKIIGALKAGNMDSKLKNHLESCLDCQSSKSMFLMMKKVKKNTESSSFFQRHKLLDPKIILNLARPGLIIRKKHNKKISSLLKIPRYISIFLTVSGLVYLCGFSGFAEKMIDLNKLNLPNSGLILTFMIIPVLLLLLFSGVSGFLSRRERGQKIKLN